MSAWNELRAEAQRHMCAGNYRDAAAAYAVAADLAIEDGRDDDARRMRTLVRQLLITEWARERWPEEGILWGDVSPAPLDLSYTTEMWRFTIRRPYRKRPLNYPGYTAVVVSSNGRIRIQENW